MTTSRNEWRAWESDLRRIRGSAWAAPNMDCVYLLDGMTALLVPQSRRR